MRLSKFASVMTVSLVSGHAAARIGAHLQLWQRSLRMFRPVMSHSPACHVVVLQLLCNTRSRPLRQISCLQDCFAIWNIATPTCSLQSHLNCHLCALQVDAALDLSHTQNIGRMIKAHFPQSQFVVVSLKEGMFNNANVLFRTKFVDGVSTVMRTATRRWVYPLFDLYYFIPGAMLGHAHVICLFVSCSGLLMALSTMMHAATSGRVTLHATPWEAPLLYY